MQALEFTSRLLPDGHLSCPQDIARQLRDQKDVRIRVMVTPLERPVDRKRVVEQTFGMFRDVPTSSDAFAERKAQEKHREARRWAK